MTDGGPAVTLRHSIPRRGALSIAQIPSPCSPCSLFTPIMGQLGVRG
jgi:hypothetical protein